jgi:hypothetical protein
LEEGDAAMSDELPAADPEFVEKWLARPATMPEQCIVCVKGLPEEEAKRLGELICLTVREFSRIIDLERLDGVTVAADYVAALLELDRGFKATQPLTPTTENATGIAMTPAVLRDGTLKSHIVFNASVALQLDHGPNVEGYAWAFYTVAHECAHVQLRKTFDQSFPGLILNRTYKDYEESFIFESSNACWEEYAASRLSAPFGEKQLTWYEETFVTALQKARERGNAIIRAFRSHGDVNRLLKEIVPVYTQVLTFASYVLGHLAGIGADRSAAEKAETALEGHWFAPHYARLAAELEKLWSRYGAWSDLNEFTAIGEIAKNVMHESGVDLQRRPNGQIYVNVPFSMDTMPDPHDP